MVSIFEHTSSPVVLHVFHDDTLTQDNRDKFIRTSEKYSQSVEFIDITKHKTLIDARLSEMCGKYTIGTIFRMFMPDELPELDKVIYFDIDLMISLDIKELWDTDFEGKSIAGVHDESFVHVKPFPFSERGALIKFTKCRIDAYINAGVVVMNLKKIREQGSFVETSIKWFERYGHLAFFPDQDALNSIFLDDIKYIDGKFNTHKLERNMEDCIFHACTRGLHPWDSFGGRIHEKFFWSAFRKSAWGEDMTIEEFVGTICGVAQRSGLTHVHGKQCAKVTARKMRERVMKIFNGEHYKILRVLFIELRSRIRRKRS